MSALKSLAVISCFIAVTLGLLAISLAQIDYSTLGTIFGWLAGTFISGLFAAFMYGANSYIVILILLFLGGLGNSMWNVSAWTLMSDIGEKNKIEGSVIGAYISIAKIGAFLSFLVSGFVVQYFGINTLFLFNGVLIVIGTIVAYPLVKYE